jgi:hypothetical protein
MCLSCHFVVQINGEEHFGKSVHLVCRYSQATHLRVFVLSLRYHTFQYISYL